MEITVQVLYKICDASIEKWGMNADEMMCGMKRKVDGLTRQNSIDEILDSLSGHKFISSSKPLTYPRRLE
jgi:hypothetical protein